jgi:hypothetical protein
MILEIFSPVALAPKPKDERLFQFEGVSIKKEVDDDDANEKLGVNDTIGVNESTFSSQ